MKITDKIVYFTHAKKNLWVELFYIFFRISVSQNLFHMKISPKSFVLCVFVFTCTMHPIPNQMKYNKTIDKVTYQIDNFKQ